MSSLTGGELEVMRVLWACGEMKPSEIQAKYCRPIKNAALRFQLKVLLEKGHVSRSKVGKAYYYKAVTAQQGTLEKMARRMADVFCQGSTVGLIAELIKAEKLDEGEVRQLRALALGGVNDDEPDSNAG